MLSVTDLSSYLYCPRKLYLRKVLKCKEPTSEAIVVGSIIHKAFETFTKKERRVITQFNHERYELAKRNFLNLAKSELMTAILAFRGTLKALQLRPSHIFQKGFPLIERHAKFRFAHIVTESHKRNVVGGELWEALPKIKSEFRISSKEFALRGIIDMIEVDGASMVPVELKTGATPPEGLWAGHRIQLVAYAMLLEEAFSTSIPTAKIHYLTTNTTRTLHLNAFMKDEFHKTLEQVKGLLTAGEPPGRLQNQEKCQNCGLRRVCFDDKLIEKKTVIFKK